MSAELVGLGLVGLLVGGACKLVKDWEERNREWEERQRQLAAEGERRAYELALAEASRPQYIQNVYIAPAPGFVPDASLLPNGELANRLLYDAQVANARIERGMSEARQLGYSGAYDDGDYDDGYSDGYEAALDDLDY